MCVRVRVCVCVFCSLFTLLSLSVVVVEVVAGAFLFFTPQSLDTYSDFFHERGAEILAVGQG